MAKQNSQGAPAPAPAQATPAPAQTPVATQAPAQTPVATQAPAQTPVATQAPAPVVTRPMRASDQVAVAIMLLLGFGLGFSAVFGWLDWFTSGIALALLTLTGHYINRVLSVVWRLGDSEERLPLFARAVAIVVTCLASFGLTWQVTHVYPGLAPLWTPLMMITAMATLPFAMMIMSIYKEP